MSAPNRLVRPQSQTANLSTLRRLRSLLWEQNQTAGTAPAAAPVAARQRLHAAKSLTTLQEAHPRNLPEVWFNSTLPVGSIPRRPDERKVKLGKTLRILQERLPTLLQSPLPQEILAPNISLHLFPSTHPHLPVVSGRVAYIAALWTSPIAWNRIPIIGNVRLEILSERMVNRGGIMGSSSSSFPSSGASGPRRDGGPNGGGGEQLIVKWRTIGKTKGWGLPFVSGRGEEGAGGGMQEGKDFTGLFIFEFDGEGRILSHTIEHVQEGGDWERGVGAKVVGLTDWLLGGIRGRGSQEGPCPAFHAPQGQTRRGS